MADILPFADIGRMHWFVSTGVLAIARQQKMIPVVGDAIAKFRRDLKVFQSFEIYTRLMGWNHKWGFLEHRFVRDHRVIGVVAIRGIFNGPKGPLGSGNSADGSRARKPSRALPEWANCFQQGSELLSEALREEERTQGLRARNG